MTLYTESVQVVPFLFLTPIQERARKLARVAARELKLSSEGARTCEDCGVKPARWALRTEQYMRWCKGCSKAHGGGKHRGRHAAGALVVCLRYARVGLHARVAAIICADRGC